MYRYGGVPSRKRLEPSAIATPKADPQGMADPAGQLGDGAAYSSAPPPPGDCNALRDSTSPGRALS